MGKDLAGSSVAIIGGDQREVVLMQALIKLKGRILAVGYENLLPLPVGAEPAIMAKALKQADSIILPLPGLDERGGVKAHYAAHPLRLTPQDFDLIRPKTLVLTGVANQYLKNEARRRNLRLLETGEMAELAISNSVPTAEGALAIAIQETGITIHGARVFVFGFGRIGITLARMLNCLGAKVAVVARNDGDLARVAELNYEGYHYGNINGALGQGDIIFNTVPHPVLTADRLQLLKHGSLIIDLASAPGGTDFETAADYQIKAIHALGLPGKVAPVSAGQILGRFYSKLLLQELSGGKKEEMVR